MLVSDCTTRTVVPLPAVCVPRQDGGGPTKRVDSWQAYLVEVAYHLRQVATDNPDVLWALTTTSPDAPWLRPLVGDVMLVEAFLASMKRYGFSDEDTATMYRVFFTRVLGLLCVQAAGAVPVHGGVVDAETGAYPMVDRLRPELSRDRDADDFDDAMDDLLTVLERDLDRYRRTHHRTAPGPLATPTPRLLAGSR